MSPPLGAAKGGVLNMKKHPATPATRLLLAALVLAALPVLYGCPFSTDDGDGGPPPEPPPSRDSVTNLLTKFFPEAYETQDSILYEQMLDDDFQFEFLAEDLDQVRDLIGEATFWGKTFDLRSTGSMFRDAMVTEITLDVRPTASQPYTGEFCENCTEVDATVTLRVTTDQTGTEEPLIYAVDSPQTFICKRDPDPAFPGQFVIFKQIDRPRR
jgi:hypothetical protein